MNQDNKVSQQELQRINKHMMCMNSVSDTMWLSIINHNYNFCKFGMLKSLHYPHSVKEQFDNEFSKTQTKIDNICNVEIRQMHPLDIAREYSIIGANNFSQNHKNALVINMVSNNYTPNNYGYKKGIRDDIINLRSCLRVVDKDEQLYPLGKENSVIYTPTVNIIRPSYDLTKIYKFDELYQVAMVTVSPHYKERQDVFTKNEFIETTKKIESIFQVAIKHLHKILILPCFGFTDNNDISEVILMYNLCILKYGHYFDKIIFGIDIRFGEIIHAFDKKIIRPNLLSDKKEESSSEEEDESD